MCQKYFYTSFNQWKKLSDDIKNKYLFLAISFTIPQYFQGQVYSKFIPSKELFFDTHNNGYEEKQFFSRYFSEIKEYGKQNIINDLKNLSKQNICFLGWEEYKKLGECQFCIAWLYGISIKEALVFELTQNLEENNGFFEI